MYGGSPQPLACSKTAARLPVGARYARQQCYLASALAIVDRATLPAMMGGGRVRMMGLMAYEQAATLGNFPRAATIAISLFAISLLCIVGYLSFLGKKFGAAR